MKPSRLLSLTALLAAGLFIGCAPSEPPVAVEPKTVDPAVVPAPEKEVAKPAETPAPKPSETAKAPEATEKTGAKKEAEHAHGRIQDGPNGGRLITSVKPHLELFIMPDRKLQLTAVDGAKKAIPMAAQTASAIGGSRSAPTTITFAKKGELLVSDVAIPGGLDVPLVLSITPAAGAKKVTEKLQLNLRDCGSCDNLEYACTCDHAH